MSPPNTTYARAPAGLALAVIAAAVLAGFLPVLLIGLGEGFAQSDPYLLRVAGFTLLQAGLSTLLSVALAIPVARALARRGFPGRGLIIRLLALPLALPAIVAILGIVAIFGRNGWLGGPFDLYGLTGILLAHMFFNFPLVARMILSRLASVPPESWRLAAQLGFRDRDVWTRIEWPQISAALPGIAVLVFLLCAASFTVVLTLGGGPGATTLEVAIYQALRFDFDPPRAAGLALIQLAICAALVLLSHRFGGEIQAWQSLRRKTIRHGGTTAMAKFSDGLAIAAGLAILLPPFAAVAISGVAHLNFESDVAVATATSLAIGISSAGISLTLCWSLARAAARNPRWAKFASLAIVAGLIMPPAVLATGWFVLLSRVTNFSVPPPLPVIAMSALMALPFVYNTLAPAIADAAQQNDRLCAGLGIAGLTRFRTIDLPSLRKPLALSFVMGTIVSLGDLTAITLFGSQDFTTLPALIYRQMGSYRMETAAGSALILALFTLALVTLAERWSNRDD
jgi:thiamine transport system permease protein